MKWVKTPPEIVTAFVAAAPKDPRIARKPMFGYPALFLNGNMFAGTYQDKVVARLGDADRAKATRAGATPFEPMPGRVMKEYVVLPGSVVGKPAALAGWLEKARDHALTLPAKAKAAKATAATKAASKGPAAGSGRRSARTSRSP